MKYERFLNSPTFKRFVRRRLFDRESVFSRMLLAWFSARSMGRRLPATPEGMRDSELFKQWWYYSFELAPGVMTSSSFPADFPLLPRMLLRNAELAGCDCLDIGSVEGLMPILMCRQGARDVFATNPHLYNYEKMQAVRKLFGVNFKFRQIGSLYDVSRKLGNKSFDLINLSGVLYHVWSPMHVIAGLRPLLKKNGLMILSTNVVKRNDFSMEFNDRGKLQREATTYWYPSIPLYDYLLRYFELLGSVRRAISVIKKRTGRHEDTIREFTIGDEGLILGEPLKNFQGIFRGVPTFIGDAVPLLKQSAGEEVNS